NLIRELGTAEDQATALLKEAFGDQVAEGEMDVLLKGQIGDFVPNNILKGRIVGFAGDDVVIDVGLKSEGLVKKSEWDNPEDIEIGDDVEVLLERLEDESGVVSLSKFKADRIRGWERILESKAENDVVEGKVTRKIKGGLLV